MNLKIDAYNFGMSVGTAKGSSNKGGSHAIVDDYCRPYPRYYRDLYRLSTK